MKRPASTTWWLGSPRGSARSQPSTMAEHAVDLMEGAIADAFPLTPAIPPGQLKPTFGHEITYGIGQTVASPGRSRLRRRAVPLGRCRCGRHGVGDGRFGRNAHRRDGPGLRRVGSDRWDRCRDDAWPHGQPEGRHQSHDERQRAAAEAEREQRHGWLGRARAAQLRKAANQLRRARRRKSNCGA
jgi:hypothetical protein